MLHTARLAIGGALVFLASTAGAQAASTRGIGEVTAAEELARQVEANRASIERQRMELAALEAQQADALRRLNVELAELVRTRDAQILDLQRGYICTECHRTKTEIEAGGENFAEHIRRVGGRAVPAPTERIEAVRRDFTQRIALKRVQIQNFQNNSPAARKRAAIAALEATTAGLCQRLLGHAGGHEGAVRAEVGPMHLGWAQELMAMVSSILIARDRVSISEARKVRYETEFQAESRQVREAVRVRNEEEMSQRRSRGAQARAALLALAPASDETLQALAASLADARRRGEELARRLAAPGLSDAERDRLRGEQVQAAAEITRLQTAVGAREGAVEARAVALRDEIALLDREVQWLFLSLSSRQDSAVAPLRAAADRRKAEADRVMSSARTAATTNETVFRSRLEAYRSRNGVYAGLAAAEANRIRAACERAGCGGRYSNAAGIAASSWNSLQPCVSGHLMSKPRTGNVFNAYCTDELDTTRYLSAYTSFLASLEPADLQAVRNTTNPDWMNRLSRP